MEDGSYVVDGEWFVDELFNKLEIGDIPDDVPSKMSGWMFAKCESLPKVGFAFNYTAVYTKMNDETNEYEDFAKTLEFSIYKVENRRIEEIKILVRYATEEEIYAHDRGDSLE